MKLTFMPHGWIALALVYLVFPFDLIPDLFGPVGRVDDLLIFVFALWRLLKASPSKTTLNASARPASQAPKQLDPYELFQVPREATKGEIESRYRELVKQYHPDRVAHLGPDLRKLAHEKMLEIQQAYSVLSERARKAQ